MILIATAKMGHGTAIAKFAPLAKIPEIEQIYVLRKNKLDEIDKVKYLTHRILRLKIFYWLLSPILLAFYAIKYKASYILAYHFLPHAIFAFIAHLLTGKPFIYCQTGLVIQKQVQKKFFFRKLVLMILKRAKYINVPGNFSRNFWIDMGIDENKINILHSTIDVEVYKPQNVEKIYDFIYLGRLAPEKEIHTILEGIKYLKDRMFNVKLCVVGDGPLLEDLQLKAQELNISDNVDFVGFQLNTVNWLNKSKIIIMTSRTEGLPTALMQGMACELIAISSAVGNIPDMIQDEYNGFLYSHKDKEQLFVIMEDCLKNYDNYEDIRKNARKTIIEKHSYEYAIEKWKSLLFE